VLTARHCVTATTDGTFTCKMDGTLGSGPGGTLESDFVVSNTTVYVGPTLPDTIDPATFPGKAASYVYDAAATVTCNSDVALLVLEAPIEGAKIAPVRLSGDVTVDESLYVVGWGATETSFIPPSRQRRDDVTVVEVGPSATQHLGGQLADKEFLASESVCFGDSGGPAFDSETGAVVGTVSRGPNGGITSNGSGCVGTEHTFMKTSSFAGLIEQAFAMAGGEPWVEGEPPPGTGGGGSGGATGAGGGDGGGDESGDGCSCATPKNAGDTRWAPFAIAAAAFVFGRRRRTRRPGAQPPR
jgi:MYXO-CTERM domain-containing protein